ncbi:hypothetical protein KFL_003980160 [Klebsormidium nitens]|uniref:Uncharacterized protein n=1 Tax=Klebsormidium nitens TaxID=105231 RepID=A0A1Y1IG84_KLENI|nr:hypothetical protein KFL_003980160 [Klebsormidium nitens]|eukprot:GAQ88081.1 hypothetical protein KFL_003980160 [Klebsormidium nitens]
MATRRPQPGANVAKLVQRNDYYAAQEAHAEDLSKANQVAGWHERKFKVGTQTSAHSKDNDLSENATNEIAMELRSADKQVKMQRRARLLELFRREALQYEAELNARGLAILKDRL